MAALLAVLPDLFDRHLLLVDSVDHSAGILHRGERGLLHAAGVAVVEGGHVDHVLIGLRVDAEGRVLGPRPVKAPFAGNVGALDGFPLLVDRRQQRILPGRAPALRRRENPLHLLVAADLDDG